MKKGQIFTIDFMISVTIFILVLVTIITTWYFIDTHIKEIESRRDMHSISLSVSDALVRSSGHPADWNATNVQSIGLAKEEYVIDLAKAMGLMSLNYDEARTIMRLGNYQVYIYMTDINGYNVSTGVLRSPVAYFCNSERTIANTLDASGLIWDMYQASGADDSASHGERYYYLASDYFGAADPEAPAKMLNLTVLNLSNYKTLILEEPDIQNTKANLTGIQKFLENGGSVLVNAQGNDGYNIIEHNFSMHSEKLTDTNGVVDLLDHALVNATVGEIVSFDRSAWSFYEVPGDAQLVTYVSAQGNSTRCLMCSWSYKFGKIYYIEDFDGTLGSRPISESLNLLGYQIAFGVPPTASTDVISINRVAVLEGFSRQPVAVHAIVWR
jgi:hypothetical protein